MEGSVRRESDDQSGLRLSPSYLKRCVCVYVCVCKWVYVCQQSQKTAFDDDMEAGWKEKKKGERR